jgi:hypothetical protein
MKRLLFVLLVGGCGNQLPYERRYFCDGRAVYVVGDDEPQGVGRCIDRRPEWMVHARP